MTNSKAYTNIDSCLIEKRGVSMAVQDEERGSFGGASGSFRCSGFIRNCHIGHS